MISATRLKSFKDCSNLHCNTAMSFARMLKYLTTSLIVCFDVASGVGVNFKNVGVLSIESSLFHLFHYTFLQTKHQRKGY